MTTAVAWMAPVCALIGICMAAYLGSWVLKQDPGPDKMNSISIKIQQGAKAFLMSEYKLLVIFMVVVGIIMAVALSPITALAFATAYFALATLIIMGAALAFFGAEGGDLPVQVLSLSIPYDLTMAEATWTAVGIAYLMTLGLAGLTLLLSSKLRSQLAIFAACAALIFLTGMIPSGDNAVLLHALYLFPINGLNDQVLFNSLVSYPVGSFAIDLVGLLACVYALVLAACVPLAARAFRRHQVV